MNILRIMFVGVLVIGLPGNAIADLNEGLIAYYPFDGNANDESGKGNDGTENGGVKYVSGKYGQAASFNGVDDWIIIQDMLHISNSDFTISMWLEYPDQAEGTDDYAAILIQSTNYQYPYEGVTIFVDRYIDDGLEFRISAKSPLQSNAGKLNDNKWRHFSFVKNGSQLIIFINGELDSSRSITTFNIDSTSPIFIGANHQTQSSQNYEGLIDDLRAYDRALSESEIQELYNFEPTPIDSDGDGIPDTLDNYPLSEADSECNEDEFGDIEISNRVFQQGTHTCNAMNDIKTGLGIIIKDGAIVTFGAGGGIYIHAGFHIEKGAYFKAGQTSLMEDP